MPVTDPTPTTVVDLSRAEQWVLHHVMLGTVGLADGGVADEGDGQETLEPEIGVIEKLEAGEFEFTVPELEGVHGACRRHARTTEEAADRNLASAVADRIEATLEDGLTDG